MGTPFAAGGRSGDKRRRRTARRRIIIRGQNIYELLNPQGTEPVPVKPRYGTGRKLLIGIGVIAVAALVMAVVVQISRFADRKADTGETPAAIRIAREEAAGASSRGESTIAPAVAEEVNTARRLHKSHNLYGTITILPRSGLRKSVRDWQWLFRSSV